MPSNRFSFLEILGAILLYATNKLGYTLQTSTLEERILAYVSNEIFGPKLTFSLGLNNMFWVPRAGDKRIAVSITESEKVVLKTISLFSWFI